MKPEIKTKWLEALRSGEYQQGKVYLRQRDKYCCLGVLCDLHAKATGTQWDNGDYTANADGVCDRYLAGSCLLPLVVGRWAGVPDGTTDPLIKMNDDGESFTQIANFIEKDQLYESRSES